MTDSPLVPVEVVEARIHLVRGVKVILDADLAELYQVPTKRLNEQVRRNTRRFPADFVFQLTAREKTELVAKCDHLPQLRFSPAFPLAFTEYGAIMAASVLNSDRAIEASVQVVRAFVRLRHMVGMVGDLAQRLDELEARYDENFRVVFQAIRQLMEPEPAPGRPAIGFRPERPT